MPLCVAACKIKNDGHSVTIVGFNRTAPNSSCVTVIATVTRTRARPVAVCFVCLVYVCFDHDPLTYSKTDDHHHGHVVGCLADCPLSCSIAQRERAIDLESR